MPDPVDNESAEHRGLYRELFIKQLLALHTKHVDEGTWHLDTCEYCRCEYYIALEPVVIVPLE